MNRWIVKNITQALYNKQQGYSVLPCLEKLEQSQWYSADKLKEMQWAKFKELLDFTYDNSAYYKNSLKKMGLKPNDIGTLDNLDKIPILTKEQLKQNLQSILTASPSDSYMFRTSGSTGIPTTIYKDRKAISWHKAAKLRARRWWQVNPEDKKLLIWGRPDEKNKLEAWKDYTCDNKIKFCTQSINKENISNYLRIFNKFKPDLLYGYASALYNFAYLIKNSKQETKIHTPKVIVSTSELLYEFQKRLIEAVFKSKVVNEYGSREFHLIAFECPRQNMHIANENVLVEVLDKNGNPAKEEEFGKIVITDLNNRLMPLIRYEIGDMGILKNMTCSCGRGLSTMEVKIGKDKEMLVLPDKSRIDPDIFSIPHDIPHYDKVSAFKIIQKSIEDFEIYINAESSTHLHLKRHFTDTLDRYIGKDCNVDFKFNFDIPRSESGKLTYFVSEVED